MIERWATCYLSPNYEVSDIGRVRNKRNGHFLKVVLSSGYPVVKLRGVKYVGVLVYRSFDPFFDPFKVIGYRDGNRQNVTLENLYQRSKPELCREKYQNMSDQQKKSLHDASIKGSKSYSEKYTKEQFREIMKRVSAGMSWPSWAKTNNRKKETEKGLNVTHGRRVAFYAGQGG